MARGQQHTNAKNTFAFFSVTLGAHKYFAVSRDPVAAWAKLQKDATREVPWTRFGETLKHLGSPEFKIENEHMKLKDALDMLHGVADAARFTDDTWYVQPNFSSWDDVFDDQELEHVDMSPFPSQMQPFDWASPEATAEFERLVFTSHDPTTLVYGSTTIEVMANAFAELCAKPRTWLAHGCVYNPRKKCMVIKVAEQEWCREVHCRDFAAITFPWLWNAVERVCKRALSSTRYQHIHPHFHGVMRLLHCAEQSKAKQRAEVVRKLLDVVRETARNSVGDTYEKMRRLYPAGHESAPDKMRYAKRISKEAGRNNSAPILDESLLKPKKKSSEKESSSEDDSVD